LGKVKVKLPVPSSVKIQHFTVVTLFEKVTKNQVAARRKHYEVIMWFAEIIVKVFRPLFDN